MTTGRAIEELDLLAYADGLLDPARREEVEAHLHHDADAAMRVAEYLAQNQAIRAAYGSVAAEPVPARLLAALEQQPAHARWRRPMRLTAFAASLAAAGFLGWMANAPRGSAPEPSDALVEASMALHSDWSPRPEAAAGNADGSLLLPKAIAAEQEGDVALHIPPPDLSPLGLRLVGMRGTEGKGVPGVQLIYGDGQGERVSLFLLPGGGGGTPAIGWESGERGQLAFWREGPITFALIGEHIDRSAETVAAQVRGALRGAPVLVTPPPNRGNGLAAGNGGGAAAGSMEDVPLLRPLPARGAGKPEAM